MATRILRCDYEQPIGPAFVKSLINPCDPNIPKPLTNRNEIRTTRQPHKVTRVQREVIVPEERFLVPRDLVLHTALRVYVVTETPCVWLFMHLSIRAIIRVIIIVRLCCRMLLEGCMHGYLDSIQ